MPHSSVEAGERPFRTPWSEGGAALWTGSWNHAEDTVPHQRVTAKRPSRVRDSDIPQRDEPDALTCTSGSVGAPGSNPWATRPRTPNSNGQHTDPSPSDGIRYGVLAQEARERRIISNVKPFIGTLRVTNPVRQSRASSRKRVLRGGGRPPLRSVDSEIKRCVIEPRNPLS